MSRTHHSAAPNTRDKAVQSKPARKIYTARAPQQHGTQSAGGLTTSFVHTLQTQLLPSASASEEDRIWYPGQESVGTDERAARSPMLDAAGAAGATTRALVAVVRLRRWSSSVRRDDADGARARSPRRRGGARVKSSAGGGRATRREERLPWPGRE